MLSIMHGVCIRLDILYMKGESPIPEINKLDFLLRLGIFISYLLIDLLYPISFVLLCHFHWSGLLERSEKQLLYECGLEVYKRAEGEIIDLYRGGFVYVVSHCTVLFLWLHSKGYPQEMVIFWSLQFGLPHVICMVLLACHISHVIRLFNTRVKIFSEDIKSRIFFFVSSSVFLLSSLPSPFPPTHTHIHIHTHTNKRQHGRRYWLRRYSVR